MKNILVAATRQWNPGDEFILFGVQNLIGENNNYIIYDRNPDLLPLKKIWSNSWKKQSLEKIDSVIIAGSPEWMGNALQPLFSSCLNKKQISFLGIGNTSNKVNLTNLDIQTLRNAKIIITRDEITKQSLLNYKIKSITLPCPAFYASKITKNIEKINKIGFVIQSNEIESQKISKDLMQKSLDIYNKLKDIYEVNFIYHYINELFNIPFKGDYSYDAKDYINIYNKYDLIITTRLHGAVLASSLGIPSILLNTDARCISCSNQIPYIINNFNYEINFIKEINVKEINENLIKFKNESFINYKNIIEYNVIDSKQP
jgi:hypothetical protein